jgi:predicted  nucleic acid-binding Zn-ribbon protein
LISFCSSSTNKDKFSSILQQFVELNEEIGAQKEDLGVIIAQVKNTLSTGAKQYASFFSTVETHCASAVAKLNGAIKGLDSSANEAKSQLNNWNKNLAAATKDTKDAQANLVKGRAQLKALRKRISKIAMDYRVYATEADKKQMVVKILRDIITDELFNKGPRALVQLNKFQEKLVELKGLLNNNSDSLYSPIISVLLDLATEQNFSDQGVLKKILTNLNNLSKALKDFRIKQEKSLDADMKNIKKQVKNVRQRNRAYRRMRAQATSKKIDAAHYISFYKHEIDHFTAEKNRMGDELRMFQKLCVFEKSIHKSGSAAYKKKKQIVAHIFSSVQKLK